MFWINEKENPSVNFYWSSSASWGREGFFKNFIYFFLSCRGQPPLVDRVSKITTVWFFLPSLGTLLCMVHGRKLNLMWNSGPLTRDVKMAMRPKMKAGWSLCVAVELRGLEGDLRQSHYDIICLVNICKIYAHFDYCKFFKIMSPGLYNILPRLSVFSIWKSNGKIHCCIIYLCAHVCVHVCL